jgi:hypothetical protein
LADDIRQLGPHEPECGSLAGAMHRIAATEALLLVKTLKRIGVVVDPDDV